MDGEQTKRSICDYCGNVHCPMQSGVVREHCWWFHPQKGLTLKWIKKRDSTIEGRTVAISVMPDDFDDRERICLRALDHFGVEHQKWKLVEELGELLVEIAREHIGRGNKDAIREELADANIMCQQMRIVYGAAKVDGWIRRKLERLVKRMNEEGPDGCE